MKTEGLKRAAIYCRVSDPKQTKNYSLTTQEESCQNYCQKQGYSVAVVFREQYTGTALNRPELDRLRILAHDGGFDVLVCLEIDRLGRDLLDQLLIEDELVGCGVRIEYALTEYSNTPEGELQRNLRRTFAEYERRQIIQRTMRGTLGYIKAGGIPSSRVAPYGYIRVARTASTIPRYEIDAEEEKIVLLIFTLFVINKLSLLEIADELTTRQIPTRYDSAKAEQSRPQTMKRKAAGVWSASTVGNITTNEMYAGTAYYGKSRTVWYDSPSGQRKKRQEPCPREQWIAIPVPAIISRELWEQARVQAALNSIIAPRNNHLHDYLMRGLVICSRCGRRFGGRGSGRNRLDTYYTCGGAVRSNMPDNRTKICNGAFRADWIDGLVWREVVAFMLDPLRVDAGIESERRGGKEKVSALGKRQRALVKLITDKQAAKARLLDLYIDGGRMSKEDFAARDSALDQEIADRQQEHEALKAQLAQASLPQEQIEAVRAVCAEFAVGAKVATFEEQRSLVEALNIRGIVQRGATPEEDVLIITGSIMPSVAINLATGKNCDHIAKALWLQPFRFVFTIPLRRVA